MKDINKQTNNKSILKSKDICNKKILIMGKYYSSLLKILDNEKIKSNLIKINSLNSNYIKEYLDLNKFTAFNCGKFSIKIYIKSILSDTIKKTLEFNIYINNKLRKKIEYSLERRVKKDVIILTNLEVKKNDILSFDYSIKERKGKLILNRINYEINFCLENEKKLLMNKNISLKQIVNNKNKEIFNQNNKDLNLIEDEINNTSFLLLANSDLESLSGTATNQETVNKENVNDHLFIHDSINNFRSQIGETVVKIPDEEEFQENNLVLEEIGNLDAKTLTYPITNNDIFFLVSSIYGQSLNFIRNGGLNLINENVNIFLYNGGNISTSYRGIYMNIVSNYNITFSKFVWPEDLNNPFDGVKRISSYSFPNVQINDGNNTELIGNYSDYDFLILKSQVENNKQTVFNIIKTDKIISQVALNYFDKLQYLTFIDKKSFTTSDSSLLGIWGFKSDRQLKKIAVAVDKNLLFSEKWSNYQFIFVSYYFKNNLAGILIPTNSIILNNQNVFSLDGYCGLKLIDEFNGSFDDVDKNLSNVEIYGFNHIWKEEAGISNTLELSTVDNNLEGGENQAEVNENVQNNLNYLENTKADKSDLNSLNTIVSQNTADLKTLENGTYNYPQLTLNGDTIDAWPSGRSGGISNSSELTDDSEKNPVLGINPWKTKINSNENNILGLRSGKYSFSGINLNGERITEWPQSGAVISSELADDSGTNPNLGINPKLLEIDKNKTDITVIEEGTYNYPQLTLNGEAITEWPQSEKGISNSSELTDDSNTKIAEGINPSLNQIIANQNKILELESRIEGLELPIGSIIISVLPPSYGVWTTLGTLAEGQAIIGGNSSNGNIISHSHQWSAGITTFSAGLVVGIGNSINKFNTYDQLGNAKSIGSNVLIDNNDTSQTAWTSLTGDKDNRNKAYGLGIGTGMRIFRRTA